MQKLGLVLCFATWLRLGCPAAHAEDAPVAKPTAPPTVVDRIVTETNAVRQQHQLRGLATNPHLTAAAQGLADFMAQTGRFSHQADGRTVGQRVELQQYRWTYVAENIVFHSDGGQPAETAARMLMQQWLNSPGHRQNILSGQASEIGVGTARGANGAIYAVQVFAAPAQ